VPVESQQPPEQEVLSHVPPPLEDEPLSSPAPLDELLLLDDAEEPA
jgi:hypothetical protein